MTNEHSEQAKMLRKFWDRREAILREQYESLREQHRGDAGTQGDQGEEDWAELLKAWIPPRFPVVTKGRIAGRVSEDSPDGMSGQVDVVVLHPDYPTELQSEKTYIAEGVVAAFECKNCVTAKDVRTAVDQARRIASITPIVQQTPWEYACGRTFFGLLAHTHSWAPDKPWPMQNVERNLHLRHDEVVESPREMVDAVCVADLGYISATRSLLFPGEEVSSQVEGGYMVEQVAPGQAETNIGSFVRGVWEHLYLRGLMSWDLVRSAILATMPGGGGTLQVFDDVVPESVLALRRPGGREHWWTSDAPQWSGRW